MNATVTLRYLESFRAKGRTYWYVRRDGKRTRLPGNPGSPEFHAAYQEATAPLISDAGAAPGSMAALIAHYRASPGWKGLAEETQRQYLRFLDDFRDRYGTRMIKGLPRSFVFLLRDRFAEKSAWQANKATAVLSILMTHAVNYGWRPDNPALRPKRLSTKGGGYRAWTDDEIERFLAAAPPHVALACLLGLGTAQRSQDLVRMTWTAYRDDEIEVVQCKGGERVWIPVHGRLAKALEARRADLERARQEAKPPKWALALTILTSLKGRSYTPGNLSHDVRDAVVAAKLPDGLVMHGWRTTGLTWLAEAGCTQQQIRAISGHKDTQMVEHYTRDANRKDMARAAIVKLRRKKK